MVENELLPIYNLKAVVQETGLKPDTLRAWERRYGIPEPQRTASGHRLYTQQDIDILKWLIARQSEGLTISRAVALWRELVRQGQNPTTHPVSARTPQSSSLPSHNEFTVPESASSLHALREQWINACLRFDEGGAEQTLNNAFAIFPPETVLLGLIQPALAEVGAGWQEGRVTVQQEHFASALAMRRMEALFVYAPVPTRSGRILVGCPPHEQHTFVPMLLALLLRRRGWEVVYLGADVPIESMEQTVEAVSPRLVILTAQQIHTAASLLDMSTMLLQRRVPVAYGGLVFIETPEVRSAIPGHFLGSRLDSAVEVVEGIMASPRVRRADRETPPAVLEALRLFRVHRPQIEADVRRELAHSDVPQAILADADAAYGRAIEAALALDIIGQDAVSPGWIGDLLVKHSRLPALALGEYLRAYASSAGRRLNMGAPILTDWLEELAASLAEPDEGENERGFYRQSQADKSGRR